MNPSIRDAIVRAARARGIDPSYALAVAERESNFDPEARASKTIRGLFQMRGDLRQQYGVGDTGDPYAQAEGWSRFIGDTKAQMSQALGRPVTDAEAYAGHHFGAGRAARMMRMDPNTPVDTVFTPTEMAQNPHFARAGTVGNLLGSVTSDIQRRQAKFQDEAAPAIDLADQGTPMDSPSITPDFSSFGTLADASSTPRPPQGALDLSTYGTPA